MKTTLRVFSIFAGVCLIALSILSYFYDAFKVPTGSMADTICPGDYILADMDYFSGNEPKAGDVVIFSRPHDTVRQIDRIVAQPGDTILMVDKSLFINGLEQRLPLNAKLIDTLTDGSQRIIPRTESSFSRDNFGPYVIPEKSYFVLGDNRDNAYDSRFWGFVPRENILGLVKRVYWSSQVSRILSTVD